MSSMFVAQISLYTFHNLFKKIWHVPSLTQHLKSCRKATWSKDTYMQTDWLVSMRFEFLISNNSVGAKATHPLAQLIYNVNRTSHNRGSLKSTSTKRRPWDRGIDQDRRRPCRLLKTRRPKRKVAITTGACYWSGHMRRHPGSPNPTCKPQCRVALMVCQSGLYLTTL